MQNGFLKSCALTLLVFRASIAGATDAILSPAEVYVRCHSQIVRRPPPRDDQQLQKIKAGTLSAPAACGTLIARARLDPDGQVDAGDPTAQEVLRTFQSLHSSWFRNHDLNVVERDWASSNIYDTNEMGYHLTAALLGGGSFSEITTNPQSYRGLRSAALESPFLTEINPMGKIQTVNAHPWMQGDTKPAPFQPQLVRFGRLTGMAPQITGRNVIQKQDAAGATVQLDLNRSLGGGILGAPSYILLSSTLPPKVHVDDQRKVHRAWSKAIFEDLLCRTLPVVNPGDVAGLVQKGSELSFRRQESCMQCHATMDPLAGVLRRIDFNWSTAKTTDNYVVRAMVEQGPGVRAPSSGPTDGRLFFRDYRGKLVDQPVRDIPELGRDLSTLDDLYICFAKRYFEFFTGIDVGVRDFSREEKPSGQASKYRDFVISLGLDFKKHQSSKQLIDAILSSSFYSRRDYGWAP